MQLKLAITAQIQSLETHEATRLLTRDKDILSSILTCFPYDGKKLRDRLTPEVTIPKLALFYSEISGPVDRWWRNDNWMRRGIIRYACTPTMVKGISRQLGYDQLSLDVERLGAFVDYLESPEMINYFSQTVTLTSSNALMPFSGPSDGLITERYNQLGKVLIADYKAGGGKMQILYRMQNRLRDELVEIIEPGLKQASLVRRWIDDSQQVKLNEEPDKVEEFTKHEDQYQRRAIDLIKLHLIATQHLSKAASKSIDSTLDLLNQKITSSRVKEFHESLTGIWDGMVVLWKSRGTVYLDKVQKENYQRYVIKDADVKSLSLSISKHYGYARAAIYADAFNLGLTSKVDYKGIQRTVDELRQKVPPEVFDGKGMLRAEILVGFLDTVDLGIGVALIGAGLVGAPISSGTSLVLAVAGTIILAADVAINVFRASGKDIATTSLLSIAQKVLYAQFVGDKQQGNYQIGRASITPGDKQKESFPKSGLISRWEKLVITNQIPILVNDLFSEGTVEK